MLGTKDDEYWNELIKEADINGDGEVKNNDFKFLD